MRSERELSKSHKQQKYSIIENAYRIEMFDAIVHIPGREKKSPKKLN